MSSVVSKWLVNIVRIIVIVTIVLVFTREMIIIVDDVSSDHATRDVKWNIRYLRLWRIDKNPRCVTVDQLALYDGHERLFAVHERTSASARCLVNKPNATTDAFVELDFGEGDRLCDRVRILLSFEDDGSSASSQAVTRDLLYMWFWALDADGDRILSHPIDTVGLVQFNFPLEEPTIVMTAAT